MGEHQGHPFPPLQLPETFLRAKRHPFAVLLFLEKPFPLCDLQGGSSTPVSSHHWWETSALPPFCQPLHCPCQNHRFLQVLGQCLECSLPRILLVSHSSFSLSPKPWSSILWAGARTCRSSPQILPCLLM